MGSRGPAQQGALVCHCGTARRGTRAIPWALARPPGLLLLPGEIQTPGCRDSAHAAAELLWSLGSRNTQRKLRSQNQLLSLNALPTSPYPGGPGAVGALAHAGIVRPGQGPGGGGVAAVGRHGLGAAHAALGGLLPRRLRGRVAAARHRILLHARPARAAYAAPAGRGRRRQRHRSGGSRLRASRPGEPGRPSERPRRGRRGRGAMAGGPEGTGGTGRAPGGSRHRPAPPLPSCPAAPPGPRPPSCCGVPPAASARAHTPGRPRCAGMREPPPRQGEGSRRCRPPAGPRPHPPRRGLASPPPGPASRRPPCPPPSRRAAVRPRGPRAGSTYPGSRPGRSARRRRDALLLPAAVAASRYRAVPPAGWGRPRRPAGGLLSPRKHHGEGAVTLRHGVTKRRPGPERRRRAGCIRHVTRRRKWQ